MTEYLTFNDIFGFQTEFTFLTFRMCWNNLTICLYQKGKDADLLERLPLAALSTQEWYSDIQLKPSVKKGEYNAYFCVDFTAEISRILRYGKR